MDSPPARPPRRLQLPLADGVMSAVEFGDPVRPVDVVWAHANGFNALTYRHTLAPLGERLRVVALDLRGHGLTEAPTDAARLTSWSGHARDILQALEGLGAGPVTLAGHSMGATSALLAAAQAPERVSRLVLFDPVVLSRAAIWSVRLPGGVAALRRRLPLAAGAARRRAGFPSEAAAVEALSGRGAFKGWPEAALADYVAGGVRPAPDGGVALSCTPRWEAANFTAQRHDPYAALRRLRAPAHILKAEHGSTCRLAPDDRALRGSGRGRPDVWVEVAPGTDHFFPLRRPELVRAALRDAAAG